VLDADGRVRDDLAPELLTAEPGQLGGVLYDDSCVAVVCHT
jgi:hypothetical protein